MDYTAHYNRLIERARYRVLEGYSERHHVLPKCMEGDNKPSNIVELTAEEHYVAHQLLVKMYPSVRGLATAAVRMAKQCTGNKAYGWLRKRHAIAAANFWKGRKRGPFSPEHLANMSAVRIGKKGSPRSAECRARMSKKLRGRKISKEQIEKLVASRRGKPLSKEARAKISIAHIGNTHALGHRHSDEARKKMSEQRRGKKRGPLSLEHRAAVGAANRRRVVSQETREKIGAAQRGKPKPRKTPAILSASFLTREAQK